MLASQSYQAFEAANSHRMLLPNLGTANQGPCLLLMMLFLDRTLRP
jgi:hypothetical protein